MYFSKSFGYAVRSVLYLGLPENKGKYIQADEMAKKLDIPKYFMAKILKFLAKEKIIKSIKGPNGGFQLRPETFDLTLIDILKVTDPKDPLEKCMLQWGKCNSSQPCPVHYLISDSKNLLISNLTSTSLLDLVLNPADPNKHLFDIDKYVK